MIVKRKVDHIEICLSNFVEHKNIKTLFNDVKFIHSSLPEIDFDDIDLSVVFLGHKLNAPIIISAMTGGTEKAYKINSILASLSEKFGIGMGVGSQRIAIEKPELSYTFSVVRKMAPNTFIIGNIGAVQLRLNYGVEEVKKAVEMIDANALAIHFNPLQEVMQHEGEPFYSNVLEKIKLISSSINVPLIAKETGAGFSREVALKLHSAGFSAIDIAGAGGTSWAAVEYYRSLALGNERHAHLARVFWDWGIPTAASLCEVRCAVNLPIIASGGIRSGLDAAKALALGADCVGMALPLLRVVVESGFEGAYNFIKQFIDELKVSMFLVGVRKIKELQHIPLIITGALKDWLETRGFLQEFYNKRVGNI
ncbi:MAG: type 2 isopentenyl-diphosphate Delta-isomerase [Candidatus Methanomethylicia archaeon]|nr:type 2 isopentenyl-diphosphate Delta-isomerase [Candidatus Methanomethylicia archaeon]MCX8169073.1 type 2 isopentenyl-diphosphate Delta-isomerase [Candidatus Methanomethylicia archaeon]MDW7988805.1 type 2 isopentenyl-diphosphate Delta-isomerase [Nitrososphaerota archaeon]